MNDPISEKLCMCFIRWCEHHGRLNAECGLSTIEYIRSRKPIDALKYINGVMSRYGQKQWKMPKMEDEKLQFERKKIMPINQDFCHLKDYPKGSPEWIDAIRHLKEVIDDLETELKQSRVREQIGWWNPDTKRFHYLDDQSLHYSVPVFIEVK